MLNTQSNEGYGEASRSLSPTFASIGAGTAEDIDTAVRSAEHARDGLWGRLAPAEKGRLLARLGRAILDHADELASIEARDCGKPLRQARADVAACARYFEFYGGAADKLTGETIPYPSGYTALTWRELSRSWPTGFSSTTRARSAKPDSPSPSTVAPNAAGGIARW